MWATQFIFHYFIANKTFMNYMKYQGNTMDSFWDIIVWNVEKPQYSQSANKQILASGQFSNIAKSINWHTTCLNSNICTLFSTYNMPIFFQVSTNNIFLSTAVRICFRSQFYQWQKMVNLNKKRRFLKDYNFGNNNAILKI